MIWPNLKMLRVVRDVARLAPLRHRREPMKFCHVLYRKLTGCWLSDNCALTWPIISYHVAHIKLTGCWLCTDVANMRCQVARRRLTWPNLKMPWVMREAIRYHLSIDWALMWTNPEVPRVNRAKKIYYLLFWFFKFSYFPSKYYNK